MELQMNLNDNNFKKLKEIIESIEKEYGKGSATFFGNKEIVTGDVISSGSLSLDHIIGTGGYPSGRIIEIYGPESSGKTTLAIHAVKSAQKNNSIVAYIDVEHALDLEYAKNIGVDLNNLIISQPDSGEQALSIVESLIKTQQINLIILDSVAALVPLSELEGRMEDQQMGAQARLMSKALRKLSAIISKTNTCVIFINQLREKVGVVYGNPEVTSGGRALKYFSSLRLDIRKREDYKKDGIPVGQLVNIKIVKNKMAPPFSSTTIKIIYGKGIDQNEDIIQFALLKNILIKKGSWIYFNNEMLVQGVERLKEYLENNLEIKKQIIDKINASV